MAILPNVFRADDNRGSSFEPLPFGWYDAEITKSELKETKAGGKMIAITFRILSEEYANRLIYANYNIVNANPLAVEIAHRELAALCDACGVDELEDTADLHNIPLSIKLKITEGNAQYPDRNDVAGYKKL